MRTPRIVQGGRLAGLALAIVLGILGMHVLAGGDHAAMGASGMSGMSGMPGMPGTADMPAHQHAAASGLAVATAAVLDPGTDAGGGSPLMVCALMIAGGLVIALAAARGRGRALRRPPGSGPLSAVGAAVVRAGWPPPGAGPPPSSWRFSVVRC
ncbi:hypothetical protein [Nocardioides fonticola]|uniref:hypothetical protein n=1 Tax=Nocardioides fonticola TaxID=450363 RepID=UPI0031D64E3B